MDKNYESRDDLIIKHLPLVRRVVGRIETSDNALDQEDLVSIGVIGLMDAIDRYDPSKKVPFEAYASLRIRGTVIDELRKLGKVSRNKIDKLNEYYRTKDELEKNLMRTAKESEIVEELGLKDRDLSKIHETVHYLSAISLESAIYSTNGYSLIDIIEDKNTVGPEDRLIDLEMKEILTKAISSLEKRDQIILNLYYVEDLTLKEIAHILNVSAPRTSQLHGRILLRLREYIENFMEVA